FWPGPLTIVFPASRSAPPEILQGSRTIAVRVPSSRPALRVLEVLGEPVTGTSANISGQPAAVTAEQALAQVGGRVDAVVVDDEAVRAGKPSTVVELTPEGLLIRRVGVLDVDQIRQVVGGRVVVAVSD
ncbi:MAG: L-threonylcarbamoyladenylate synthase, partial [Terriglobales bacterium]